MNTSMEKAEKKAGKGGSGDDRGTYTTEWDERRGVARRKLNGWAKWTKKAFSFSQAS